MIYIIVALGVCLAGFEHGIMKAPIEESPAEESAQQHQGYLVDTLSGALWAYQGILRPGLSRGCPSHPSCSHYMTLSIAQYGAIRGPILGLERLLHESSEIHHGKYIQINNQWKVYDPLINNTFWWDSNNHENN